MGDHVTFDPGNDSPSGLRDAIDLAADQGRVTWITDPSGARRLAAVVPAPDAEYLQDALKSGQAAAVADQVFRIIGQHYVAQARYVRDQVVQQTCNCGASWKADGTSGLAGHWREMTWQWFQGRS